MGAVVMSVERFFTRLGFDWNLVNYLYGAGGTFKNLAWTYQAQTIAEIALMMRFDVKKILEAYDAIYAPTTLAIDSVVEDRLDNPDTLLPIELSFEAALNLIACKVPHPTEHLQLQQSGPEGQEDHLQLHNLIMVPPMALEEEMGASLGYHNEVVPFEPREPEVTVLEWEPEEDLNESPVPLFGSSKAADSVAEFLEWERGLVSSSLMHLGE